MRIAASPSPEAGEKRSAASDAAIHGALLSTVTTCVAGSSGSKSSVSGVTERCTGSAPRRVTEIIPPDTPPPPACTPSRMVVPSGIDISVKRPSPEPEAGETETAASSGVQTTCQEVLAATSTTLRAAFSSSKRNDPEVIAA